MYFQIWSLDLTTDRRLCLWSGLKWHPLEETSLRWELKDLLKRFVTCEVWNIWWQVAFEACSKTCDSSSDILRHWKSTEHDLTKKEWCDIWSNKTCDRANATSCSALNWGLMEGGLMKRNVTWLAMSLEDSADRSKISTRPPHSTLERRSQIWWRATLNYLVEEDHLERWSNQMAAVNNKDDFISQLSLAQLWHRELCLVDNARIPMWHLRWSVTRCACCDETDSKAWSHKNVWDQTHHHLWFSRWQCCWW